MMMTRMYEWCNGGAVASHDSHDEWEWEGSLARYGQSLNGRLPMLIRMMRRLIMRIITIITIMMRMIMVGLQQEGVCYLTVVFSKISICTKIIFGPNLNLRYVGGSGRV